MMPLYITFYDSRMFNLNEILITQESQFPVINLQPVFVDDSKLSSHPIVQTVENPDQINAMFDTISYDKV